MAEEPKRERGGSTSTSEATKAQVVPDKEARPLHRLHLVAEAARTMPRGLCHAPAASIECANSNRAAQASG